jgi:ribosomal protein S8
MKKYNSLRYLLAVIKRSMKNNQKLVLVLKSNIEYRNILKLLGFYGFIQSFEEKEKYILVRLKQLYLQSRGRAVGPFINIDTVEKINKRHVMSYVEMQKIQKQKGAAFLYVFSTSSGIVPSQNSIKSGHGGIPLFKIV